MDCAAPHGAAGGPRTVKRGRPGRTALLSLGNEQPTQNWYGQGESDCLIKTKHCDGVQPVLTQCDFCPVL